MMYIKHVMHHPMFAQFTLLLLACLLPFVCLLFWGLDDDVEGDESYVYPTEECDQYQAADPSGKYSPT